MHRSDLNPDPPPVSDDSVQDENPVSHVSGQETFSSLKTVSYTYYYMSRRVALCITET